MSGEMTEFRITSDLAAIRQQVITANFEEVRSWLDENLEPYRNLAVTADGISTAKAYRANIRKVRDRIDGCRKEAKAAALAAYAPFEERCKELTGLCEEAANALDVQIKDFEQREAEAKIARIHEEYDNLADEEIREYLPWGCVNNPKWGNKGYSFDDAVDEIAAAIQRVKNDIIAIRENGGEDTAYLLDFYKQHRDLSATIRKASELMTMRKREEQREREEAERRAAREREAIAETKNEIEVEDHAVAIPPKPEAVAQSELVTIDFRVTCTKKQLTALGEYMKENGIKYGRCV